MGERAADRSGLSVADQGARPFSGSPGQGVARHGGGRLASKGARRPELRHVIGQMNLLVAGGIDLDPESPGAIGAASSISALLRDDLFVEFRKAGGTNEELLDWLSGITARGGRNEHLLRRVIHNAVVEASNIPGRAAVDWLVSRPDSDLFTAYLFEQAARSWLREDRKQALRWLDRNMDRFEGDGLRFVVAEWPEDDVAGAREWVETRLVTEGSSVHPSSVSDVARLWARQDPAGAFGWLNSLEDRWHEWALLGIAQGLPDDELSAAADWLGRNRDAGRELDGIRTTVANRIARSEPRTAIDVAADITNPAESEKLIITAARNLYLAEPDVVLRWLPESGLTSAAQNEIVSGD